MCCRFELVGGQRIFTRFQVANPDPALLALPGVDPQDIRRLSGCCCWPPTAC